MELDESLGSPRGHRHRCFAFDNPGPLARLRHGCGEVPIIHSNRYPKTETHFLLHSGEATLAIQEWWKAASAPIKAWPTLDPTHPNTANSVGALPTMATDVSAARISRAPVPFIPAAARLKAGGGLSVRLPAQSALSVTAADPVGCFTFVIW